MRRGQVLVEFAFVLPVILFLALGLTEAGFLFIAKAHQDRVTSVIAQWAATHNGESWHAVAEHELRGCAVDVVTPLPDLFEASTRCLYHPVVFRGWDLLVITSRESASGVPEPLDIPPVASPSS